MESYHSNGLASGEETDSHDISQKLFPSMARGNDLPLKSSMTCLESHFLSVAWISVPV